MSLFGEKSTAEEVALHFREEIKGKNIIITGASPKSIGFEVLRALAPYAKLIVVTGRSLEKLQDAKQQVVGQAEIYPLVLDLSSLASVRQAAQEIVSLGIKFDVLFNNAAIGQPPMPEWTSDGFEVNFGIDHLGHFLFTSLIMPTLIPNPNDLSSKSRIVNTASRAHLMAPIRWDDPNYLKRPEEYNGRVAYAQAKTANMLFSVGLSERFAGKGVLIYSLHPGTVKTNIFNDYITQYFIEAGWMDKEGNTIDSDLVTWKSLGQAAATYIVAAFDPSIADKPGSYLYDCIIRNDLVADHAKGSENADRLWKMSEELLGVKFA